MKGNAIINMAFDHMGRRRAKNTQRFVYNGYLQIANHNSSTSTSYFNYYLWDPTEPVATRPLAWNSSTSQPSTSQLLFYTHDGNKNVSEVVAADGSLAAHYEYAPFGAVILQRGESAATNPFRFSSEYAEDDTATVYYNYRHYEPVTGRWMSRDPIEEAGHANLFLFVANEFFSNDTLGLMEDHVFPGKLVFNVHDATRVTFRNHMLWEEIYKVSDEYEYTIHYRTHCDSHNHALMMFTGIKGNLVGWLDSFGVGVGLLNSPIYIGVDCVYVPEIDWTEGETSEDSTEVTIGYTVSLYKISGLSVGASTAKDLSGTLTIGPLKNKKLLASTSGQLKHSCCTTK